MNNLFPTHHNKLGRLGEDLLPQFESGRGGEQVDALLVQVARLRVDIRSPEEEFFFWQSVKMLCQIKWFNKI